MVTLSWIIGIGCWAYIWNKWYRPRKPKEAKFDDKPIIYSAEQREAIYDEAILRLLEGGQTPDIAKRVAASLVQAYDRQAIHLSEKQKSAIYNRALMLVRRVFPANSDRT